jgi:hypothetical protein
MNESSIRLVQRLVRLRRRREQLDKLALTDVRASQAQLAQRLDHAARAAAQQDRAAREHLRSADAAAGAAWLAAYRRNRADLAGWQMDLRLGLAALRPTVARLGSQLAESMARRKAVEALLGRLAAQRTMAAQARQGRQQDELRLAMERGRDG